MYRQLSINVVCIRYSRFSLALVKLRLGRFCRTMFGLCIDFFSRALVSQCIYRQLPFNILFALCIQYFLGTRYAMISQLSMRSVSILYSNVLLAHVRQWIPSFQRKLTFLWIHFFCYHLLAKE